MNTARGNLTYEGEKGGLNVEKFVQKYTES
jgi:hypothetical protein